MLQQTSYLYFFLPIMMIIIKINGFKHFKAQTKRF